MIWIGGPGENSLSCRLASAQRRAPYRVSYYCRHQIPTSPSPSNFSTTSSSDSKSVNIVISADSSSAKPLLSNRYLLEGARVSY